jgi:hypothetical protein
MRLLLLVGNESSGFIGCPFWSQGWGPPSCRFDGYGSGRACFDSEENELTAADCPLLGGGPVMLVPMLEEVEA